MLSIQGEVSRLAERLPEDWAETLRRAAAHAGAKRVEDLAVAASNSTEEDGVVLTWLIARLRNIPAIKREQLLVQLAQHEKAALRSEALRGLAILDAKAAIPLAFDALKIDSANDVRAASVYLLGRAGGHEVESALVTMLKSPSEHPFVRGMAAEALAKANLRSHRVLGKV